MDGNNIRSIVAATDLTQEDDRVVRAAAAIASLTGAELHVVHVRVVPEGPYASWVSGSAREAEPEDAARRELQEQVRRATPPGFEANEVVVVSGVSASHSIREHAQAASADLVVLGPHRGSGSDRPYLGTTADRLIRTAGVPCLIIRGSLDFPMRRMGVLTDFSPAARSAQDTAAAWLEAFAGGEVAGSSGTAPPQISLAHLTWPTEAGEGEEAETDAAGEQLRKEVERASEGSATIEYRPLVLRGADAVEVVAEWVRSQDLSMVVVGTQGISRLPYAYLGSLASTVARTAPCSVLLVPPGYRPSRRGRAKVNHVLTGVDFHESSWEAALWAMRYLAPDAQHELLHVIELPDLPGPLRGLSSNREQLLLAARNAANRRLAELRDLGVVPRVETHIREGRPATEIVRLAEESGTDLIVVGEQGTARGLGALLGSTAERVLFNARVPVLLARKVGDSPPSRILVAVDPSEVCPHVLDWARAIVEQFDASATVMTVVDRVLLVDELTGLPTAKTFERVEEEATGAMREWLEGMMREAGLSGTRVKAKVLVGDPSYEIIAEAARESRADLVVLGSKGGDIAPTPLIGRIVNKVVRSAPCSVLVVPARGRGQGSTMKS